jgi:hypothetical protein
LMPKIRSVAAAAALSCAVRAAGGSAVMPPL